VEGIMLKRRASAYGTGRERGDWWKWKIEPFTIDAVLIAAQPGSGRRASVFTDYTFAVWTGQTPGSGELVTIAKAYSGLTDAEIDRVDAFVRANTLSRHGPVRAVKPTMVFELAFEGLQDSNRHKSGIALRFPRIARIRDDKPPEQADTVASVRTLMRIEAT
jgi:DNA ligase-1